MVNASLRFLKRFAVLVPGLVIAYFSVRDIFPYFDKRLPLALAILLTYILGAYVLIPAAIRVIRIIWPPRHLPLYCVTPDGFASDPVNVGIIGSRDELIKTMKVAGWHVADAHTLRNIARQVLSTLIGWRYLRAPVSHLYLFGRKQDIAFEMSIRGAGVGYRHHVRFWATTFDSKRHLSARDIHWQHRRAELVKGEQLLWVGAASLDSGIAPIRHNLQITHMIHPDTNRERDLIVEQLETAGFAKKIETVKLGSPYRLANRALRGYLQTDGKMKVVRL